MVLLCYCMREHLLLPSPALYPSCQLCSCFINLFFLLLFFFFWTLLSLVELML
jgi:hypothetical protein